MLRNATTKDLDTPLNRVFSDLENANDSLLIREDGEAVAALLTGSDYQQYRAWVTEQAWTMIKETREANARLDAEEISAVVDQIVEEVRRDNRESRAAS